MTLPDVLYAGANDYLVNSPDLFATAGRAGDVIEIPLLSPVLPAVELPGEMDGRLLGLELQEAHTSVKMMESAPGPARRT